MKRIIISNLAFLLLGIVACEPIPTCDQMMYIKAKDALVDGKEISKVIFYKDGGTKTICIETTMPYWIAVPQSILDLGPFAHPQLGDDEFQDGYITYTNTHNWMKIKYKHDKMGLFTGAMEITVAPFGTTLRSVAISRDEDIYIWNDDIPATHPNPGIYINIIQLNEEEPEE